MIELNKDNFDAEVLQAKGVVFVDYWSPTCETCMALLPDVEKLAETSADKAKFCKLDTTAGNRRLAISQKVLGLPTFIIYQNGEKVATFDKDTLEAEGIAPVQKKLDELS